MASVGTQKNRFWKLRNDPNISNESPLAHDASNNPTFLHALHQLGEGSGIEFHHLWNNQDSSKTIPLPKGRWGKDHEERYIYIYIHIYIYIGIVWLRAPNESRPFHCKELLIRLYPYIYIYVTVCIYFGGGSPTITRGPSTDDVVKGEKITSGPVWAKQSANTYREWFFKNGRWNSETHPYSKSTHQ